MSERPTRVKTWARRGQTPVLQYSFNWKQLSVVAGLSFWSFYFRFHAGAIRGPQFVEFLQALTHQIHGKLLVIWDGLPAHRSRVVKNFVEALAGHIVLERLPAYAPELNPVEYIWGYMKQRELANLCLHTIGEVGVFARNRLKSMQRRPQLITAFWQQAQLPI
ncbi:MAG: transposase [Steroidobacteraceae bacterium]